MFKDIRPFFLGDDDFSPEAKAETAGDLNAAPKARWPRVETLQTFALPAIAETHESIESRKLGGGWC